MSKSKCVWHRSKKSPIATLARHGDDVRNRVKGVPLSLRPIQKLISRSNGKVTYRIYDELCRTCDAWTNLKIHQDQDQNPDSGVAPIDLNQTQSWSARYMITGKFSNDNKSIRVYQKLRPRSIVHAPPYHNAHIVYQMNHLPQGKLKKYATEVYYNNNRSKRFNYTADKIWFMPLKTTWIIPKGESDMKYTAIGIDHLRQVIHDPDVVDITYDFNMGIMWFKAKYQTEITIIRDLV